MFRGITSLSLDPKGRLVMPTRYRERLKAEGQEPLIATIDPESPCLLLYPFTAWEVIEQKIQNLPSFNKATRRIQRLLIGHATECDMDNQGRLLIPQSLRDYARLDKNLMLVGQGKKFEIWAETLWQDASKQWLLEEANKTETMPTELEHIAL
jgi:MraZ protein